ncbi:DNA/RNA non-specific endonuclease [Bizionia sediminis]|uniref:DNA/RNA non-specific endonuclease n=1 Tax=Bizionia sediminis TaxID=1737064 RepID=A0ABW5KW71_9FLAO
MKKRTIYTVIAVIIAVLVYGYEFSLKNQSQQATVAAGLEIKTATVAFLMPTSTTGLVVHHTGYSLSYNEAHEQAEWVAYNLKKEHLSKTTFKRPFFEIDKAVKTGAASWRNYKNSGYNKGHLCPAADRRFSKAAHDETFLTSNITPQLQAFNAGIWNLLEQKTRYWAHTYHDVFVVTGGILSADLKTIGPEQVSVPAFFYKVVFDYNGTKPKIIAFLIPHKQTGKPLESFVVSVDYLEVLTGIDFFPNLDDDLETALEASTAYDKWRF